MCFLLAGIVILVLILLLILILIPLPHLHVFLILILRLLLLRSKKACFATLSRWEISYGPQSIVPDMAKSLTFSMCRYDSIPSTIRIVKLSEIWRSPSGPSRQLGE